MSTVHRRRHPDLRSRAELRLPVEHAEREAFQRRLEAANSPARRARDRQILDAMAHALRT